MRIQRLDFTGSPIAEGFYLDNSPDALIVGPVMSGKTHAMFARAFRHVREQPPGPDGVSRTKIAVIRHSYKALKDTCVPSYEETFKPEFFGPVQPTNMSHKARFRLAGYAHEFELETLFRALDDPSSIRGLLSLNLSFAIVNELRECDREVYGMLRTRTDRYPTDVPPKFAGVISDSNPWHDEHWAHPLWVTNPEPGFKLFLQPPGLIMQAGKWIENPAAENPKHRRPGYYTRAIAGMDEESQRVYLRSEWGSLRGQRPVATYYNDALHCREFEPWRDMEFIAGHDAGLNGASVIGQAGPDGFRILQEVYTEGAPMPEHLELVKREFARLFPGRRLQRLYIDPAGDQRSSHTGESATQIARSILRPTVVLPAPGDNSISMRVDSLQHQLRQLNARGEPMFLLHPRCAKLRRALQSGWRYKELKGSGGHYESKPYKLDSASHIADAACYFLLGAGAGRALLHGGLGIAEDEFAEACANRNVNRWDPLA